jgi:hypothetical protein
MSTADAREIVSLEIRRHGAAAVARRLELSREAVLAFAGDFPRQKGTDALILQRLHLLDATH